jgi:glucose-1-phosphate cytidylyltransferase
MQVVIFCGGMGTRLREETDYKPKPMVEVGGRPILWHIMKIYSHFGYNDFILCLGYKQHVIREYFLNYRYMNNDFTIDVTSGATPEVHTSHEERWRVTLADTGLETRKGGRLKGIERYLTGDEFLLTYGDGVADVDIPATVESHRRSGALVTFTAVHPISRFATVEMDAAGRITDWHEKAALESYINGGFFVVNRKAIDYIEGDVEFEEEPMRRLAQEGKVNMYSHEGFWHCMDTYRDYTLLNEIWTKGSAAWARWNRK